MTRRYPFLTLAGVGLLWIAVPGFCQPAAPNEDGPLLPGQSLLGVSVQEDGKILFQGEELGSIKDAGAVQAVLSAPSPKRGLIYVNHSDRDWGGLQGSIVDPVRGKVIVKSMLPEERIRGRGVAQGVVQICDSISWSPEEDYALTVECGEVVRNIVVADLAAGTSRVIEVGDFEKDPCDWQQFAMDDAAWVSPTVYKLRVILQENPWADQPCSKDRVYPEYAFLVDARSFDVKPAEGNAPPPQPDSVDARPEPAGETVLPTVGLVRTTSRLNLRECPDAEGCGVIRTLAGGTDLEVVGQHGEWLQVRDASTGDSGWVHSSYTTAVAALPAEPPQLTTQLTFVQGAIALLLLAAPLLIGVGVWLLKPASALTRMDAWNRWLLSRKDKASSSSGFFAKYWGRPVLGLAGLLIRWTEGISDPFLRCGIRIAAFLYFAAFVLLATFLLAYMAVVIVVMIVAIIVALWVLGKVLSSDDDEPRRPTWTRKRASEDEEERRRELLLRAGARGSKVYRREGTFSEDENVRIDEQGRIYKRTGAFSEDEVGRIDGEGRVFTRTGTFSENEVGRIREDGRIYEKSGMFSEDEIGRIDEKGRIHRRTGTFSEEEIGRVERQD